MKTFTQFLTKSAEPTVTLYHGGRGLEQRYTDTVAHTKGNWEYGPGLYLTTHYRTAYKYAKGGGRVYKVTVAQGQTAEDTPLDMATMKQFVDRNVIGRKKKEVLSSLESLSLAGSVRTVCAEVFINTILNHEAMVNSKSGVLKDFLAQHGADYRVVTRYGGDNETVLVVFNSKKIQDVKVVSPDTKEFEMPFKFK